MKNISQNKHHFLNLILCLFLYPLSPELGMYAYLLCMNYSNLKKELHDLLLLIIAHIKY